MKSRLASLQLEVEELSKRFAEFEGPAVILAQNAQSLHDPAGDVQRLLEEVREELSALVSSSSEALHEEIKHRGKSTVKTVKADCSSMLAQAQAELRAEIQSVAQEQSKRLKADSSSIWTKGQ